VSKDEAISSGMMDAADYFSTVLLRAYPEVIVEQFNPKPHRLGLKITIPYHTEYGVSEVDDFAFVFMQQLYLVSDAKYLVAYTIEREQGDDDGSS